MCAGVCRSASLCTCVRVHARVSVHQAWAAEAGAKKVLGSPRVGLRLWGRHCGVPGADTVGSLGPTLWGPWGLSPAPPTGTLAAVSAALTASRLQVPPWGARVLHSWPGEHPLCQCGPCDPLAYALGVQLVALGGRGLVTSVWVPAAYRAQSRVRRPPPGCEQWSRSPDGETEAGIRCLRPRASVPS